MKKYVRFHTFEDFSFISDIKDNNKLSFISNGSSISFNDYDVISDGVYYEVDSTGIDGNVTLLNHSFKVPENAIQNIVYK